MTDNSGQNSKKVVLLNKTCRWVEAIEHGKIGFHPFYIFQEKRERE